MASVVTAATSESGSGMNEWVPSQLPRPSPIATRVTSSGSVGSETSRTTGPTRP